MRHSIDRLTPRTMQDAFGAGSSLAQHAKPLHQRLFFWLALAIVALAALSLAALAHTAPSADTSAADTKRAAINARVCPGQHAEWIDSQTVQCLEEAQP